MSKMLRLFKIGGKVLDNAQELHTFLKAYAKLEEPKVLVHGGGKKASRILKTLGIEPIMFNGRRITDEPTLEVVTQVYTGLTTWIVSKLRGYGQQAIAVSGADAGVIQAEKRPSHPVDYGFAGDINQINPEFIGLLISQGIMPVFNPITSDENGQLLNTNADTMATELAIALSYSYQVRLHLCFELPGVLEDVNNPASVINELSYKGYEQLVKEKKIAEGMIPKLSNSFNAIKNGVYSVQICSSRMLIEPKNTGTLLIWD